MATVQKYEDVREKVADREAEIVEVKDLVEETRFDYEEAKDLLEELISGIEENLDEEEKACFEDLYGLQKRQESKSAILSALWGRTKGLTTADLIKMVDLKCNQVRSVCYVLKQDGEIGYDDGVWFRFYPFSK